MPLNALGPMPECASSREIKKQHQIGVVIINNVSLVGGVVYNFSAVYVCLSVCLCVCVCMSDDNFRMP